MKKTCLFLAGCCTVLPLFAGELKIGTTPAADGNIWDSNKDGVADRVVATVLDNKNCKTANTGWAWTSCFQSVFEFQLPADFKGKKVKSATLILASNGAPHGEKNTPDLEVFYYLAPQANGAAEPADGAAGTSLGVLLPAGSVINPTHPARMDVTAALRKAAESDSEFIGFRVVSPSRTDDKKAVIWRTSEFGQDYPGNEPTLRIVLE